MTDLSPPIALKHYRTKKLLRDPFLDRCDKSANCFELSCAGCGGHVFEIIHKSVWLDEPASPICTRCVRCETQLLLFDSNLHGYNAQYDDGSATQGCENERPWTCPNCNSAGIIVACYDYCYPSDDEVFSEQNAEDWFDVFVLFHICLTDQSIHFVTGIECA